jgi:hypothetical protein
MPDETKLIMDFKTEKEYPTGSGNWRSDMGTIIINRYAHKVDFSDRISVTKLNQWRSQILSRNFSKTHKARAYWLKSEKEQVVKLIEARFTQSTQIHWNKLANTFNNANKGSVQPAGSELLSGGVRVARSIAKDRDAPWRTSASIKHAAMKWPEWVDLSDLRRWKTKEIADQIDDGEEEDATPFSEDEDEIPDPNPEPPTFEETRKLQQQKAKEDRIRRKSMTPQKTMESNSKSLEKSSGSIVKPVVEDTRSASPDPEHSISSSVQAGSNDDSQYSSDAESPRTSLAPSPQSLIGTSQTKSNQKRSANTSDDDEVPPMKRMKTGERRFMSAPSTTREYRD